MQLGNIVSTDFETVSKVMVFFELGFNDSNGQYPSIADQYRKIKTKMLGILCSMSKILNDEDRALPVLVDLSSIISENDRSLTADTDRHARDYTAIKDGYFVVQSLKFNYDRIYTSFE